MFGLRLWWHRIRRPARHRGRIDSMHQSPYRNGRFGRWPISQRAEYCCACHSADRRSNDEDARCPQEVRSGSKITPFRMARAAPKRIKTSQAESTRHLRAGATKGRRHHKALGFLYRLLNGRAAQCWARNRLVRRRREENRITWVAAPNEAPPQLEFTNSSSSNPGYSQLQTPGYQ